MTSSTLHSIFSRKALEEKNTSIDFSLSGYQNDENKDVIVQTGGVEAILSAMNRFGNFTGGANMAVQEAGCAVLWNLQSNHLANSRQAFSFHTMVTGVLTLQTYD